MQKPPDLTEEVMPALFEHCVNCYNAMTKEAETRTNEAGETLTVWTGFFTSLIRDQLHLSTPYYTSIRQILVGMGCIRQLRRGGGTGESIWELIKMPTPELFINASPPKRAAQTRRDYIDDTFLAHGNRITRLEETIHELMRAIHKLQEGK